MKKLMLLSVAINGVVRGPPTKDEGIALGTKALACFLIFNVVMFSLPSRFAIVRMYLKDRVG